jgi:eukaryotic-like serine/threonine-protein kinase
MRPTSGLTFGGRYQLSSRVAIGGMGEVWQATDLVIGRTVAIKILKDEYLGDPGFLERFRAEARHAALVNHEGIANVFDYGEEDGSAYLVMELVPGEALSAVIERERVLTTDRVLDIVAQTAMALQAAHAAGLVHRDIKPGNLLITPDGRVKITDFGIARIADQVPLTATGQVMGTVQYLSPEQASGHPASPSTDVYSLGIVAYEMLAGRRPFTGESQVAIAMAQINETPPELPVTVAEPVRNLVYASIAKNPADRPASAAHMARAAQSLRRGDVAAAAAAVPGVIGSGSLANTAGANYGKPSDATTRLLPSSPAAAPAAAARTRSPWTWPLIAFVAIAAVALIAVLIAVLNPPTDDEVTKPSNTPTITQPSNTPTSTAVVVDESEIKGRTQAQVQVYLDERGLELEARVGKPADSIENVGLAYIVSPSGKVQKGAIIAVTFYGPLPTATQTPTLTVTDGTDKTVDDENAEITWSKYTGCPSGFDLTGYQFTIANATATDAPNPVGANVTSLVLDLPSSPGQVTITYHAMCGDAGNSPESATTTITVTE